MGLSQNIDNDLKTALKSKDELRISVLRMIKSSIKNAAIEARSTVLDDDAVVAILKRELKKRNEAAETYRQGNRPELSKKEEQEAEVIKGYLPEMMSEDQIIQLVQEAIDSGATNIGAVMKQVMASANGRADGGIVQRIAKEKLQ